MSFGNMQHQLQQQQQQLQLQSQQSQSPSQPELQQHPLLSAISGNNNYAETQRVHYPWHQHQLQQHPLLQHGRPLLGASSNHNPGAWASASSGHSGYGHSMEPSVEYEVQQTPPSGSYSSYHSSGTGHSGPAYAPPHPPVHHAPKSTSPSKKKKKKSSAGSVMSALTLLSFFFFVNMLQNCIKEHIADINPTVMVLTASGSRNRFNKLAEMNSREQASSPASTTASSVAAAAAAAASSWQQAALAPVPPAVSSVVAPIIVTPAVTLHTPYSSGLVTNKPASHSHYQPAAPQQQHHHYHQQQQPDDDYNYGHRTPYAAATPAPAATLDFYPNRTHIDHSLRPDSDYYQQQQQNQQQQQQQQSYYPHEGDRQHYMNRDPAWSYGAMDDSSHLASHPVAPFSYAAGSKRYSSSASLGAQSGVSSYSDNARYRQQDDYDHHQHRHQHQHHHHRYNINARHDELDDDDDVDNGDADHRRRGIADDFYTRNN